MKRTEEERKAWAQKMRALVKQVGDLSATERADIAARCMVTTCEGHPLSVFNNAFLACQTDAPLTIVGGFRQWSKAGRAVRSGEHAAGYIYVPLNSQKNDDAADAGEEGRDGQRERLRFRLVPVFDVAQTDERTEPVTA
jgi:hypothetical protein